MPNHNFGDYLGVFGVARHLGINPNTLNSWVHWRDIPEPDKRVGKQNRPRWHKSRLSVWEAWYQRHLETRCDYNVRA